MSSDPNDDLPVIEPMTEEQVAGRKRRNLWLALSLVGFVALVLVITFVRLSQNAGMPDGGF